MNKKTKSTDKHLTKYYRLCDRILQREEQVKLLDPLYIKNVRDALLSDAVDKKAKAKIDRAFLPLRIMLEKKKSDLIKNVTFYDTMALIGGWKKIPPSNLLCLKQVFSIVKALISKDKKNKFIGYTTCVEFIYLIQAARFNNIYDIQTIRNMLKARFNYILSSQLLTKEEVIPVILSSPSTIAPFEYSQRSSMRANWFNMYSRFMKANFKDFSIRMETGIENRGDNEPMLRYHVHGYVKRSEYEAFKSARRKAYSRNTAAMRFYLKFKHVKVKGNQSLIDTFMQTFDDDGMSDYHYIKDKKLKAKYKKLCGVYEWAKGFANIKLCKLSKRRKKQNHSDYIHQTSLYTSKFSILTDKREGRFRKHRIRLALGLLETVKPLVPDIKSYCASTLIVKDGKEIPGFTHLTLKQLLKLAPEENQGRVERLYELKDKILGLKERNIVKNERNWQVNELEELLKVTLPDDPEAKKEDFLTPTRFLKPEAQSNKARIHKIAFKLLKYALKRIEQGYMSGQLSYLIRTTLDQYLIGQNLQISYTCTRVKRDLHMRDSSYTYRLLTRRRRRK